jgi:hypothetical protein
VDRVYHVLHDEVPALAARPIDWTAAVRLRTVSFRGDRVRDAPAGAQRELALLK